MRQGTPRRLFTWCHVPRHASTLLRHAPPCRAPAHAMRTEGERRDRLTSLLGRAPGGRCRRARSEAPCARERIEGAPGGDRSAPILLIPCADACCSWDKVRLRSTQRPASTTRWGRTRARSRSARLLPCSDQHGAGRSFALPRCQRFHEAGLFRTLAAEGRPPRLGRLLLKANGNLMQAV